MAIEKSVQYVVNGIAYPNYKEAKVAASSQGLTTFIAQAGGIEATVAASIAAALRVSYHVSNKTGKKRTPKTKPAVEVAASKSKKESKHA